MNFLARRNGALMQRIVRSALLTGLAASIVGIGCATIRVPPPKDETAEKIYLPAARNGDVTRQLQLGLAYRYGTAGVAQNNAEAFAWLEKAATGGSVQAQQLLGDAYLKGELGLEKQPSVGVRWLRKAADTGAPDALFYLASVLETGSGVPASPSEAAMYYEKAARGGHKFAAWKLGHMLERDSGIATRLTDAWAWYRIGDSLGDAERLRQRMKASEQRAADERLAVLRKEMGK